MWKSYQIKVSVSVNKVWLEPSHTHELPMAAERELADLDEQFSGLLPQMEMEDSMQIHGVDEDDGDSTRSPEQCTVLIEGF